MISRSTNSSPVRTRSNIIVHTRILTCVMTFFSEMQVYLCLYLNFTKILIKIRVITPIWLVICTRVIAEYRVFFDQSTLGFQKSKLLLPTIWKPISSKTYEGPSKNHFKFCFGCIKFCFDYVDYLVASSSTVVWLRTILLMSSSMH